MCRAKSPKGSLTLSVLGGGCGDDDDNGDGMDVCRTGKRMDSLIPLLLLGGSCEVINAFLTSRAISRICFRRLVPVWRDLARWWFVDEGYQTLGDQWNVMCFGIY